MSIFAFIIFCSGILLQMFYFIYTKSTGDLLKKIFNGVRNGIVKNKKAVIITAIILSAVSVIIAFAGLWDDIFYILFVKLADLNHPLVFGISSAIGVFVLIIMLFYAGILPGINEQSVFILMLVFWYLIFKGSLKIEDLRILTIFAVISAASVLLIIPKIKLNFIIKSFLYLWYLVMFFYIAAVEFPAYLYSKEVIYAPEAFLMGSAGIYIVFHAFFLVRMAVVVLSYWRKKNREYARPFVEARFSNYQITLAEFFIYSGSVLILILVNEVFDFVSAQVLTAFVILIVLQAVSYRIRNI
jgi:hypothetical protein